MTFTKDQEKAYSELSEWFKKPFDPTDYKRALSGAGGTGKTFLVKYIVEKSGISYSMIHFSAPTHKACRVLSESLGLNNVKATTIASDLGFGVNFDVTKFDPSAPAFAKRNKIKIGNIHIYILDESSMVSYSTLKILEDLAKEKKFKILYIGDAYQLSPVNERKSMAFSNVKLNSLTQIVRQDEDNPVKKLLSMLRNDVKNKTYTFLNYITKNRSAFNDSYTQGFQVCSPVEFKQNIDTYFSDPEMTMNVEYAKVIAYTNVAVSNWNKYIRHKIIEDADKTIINKNDLIMSYTTLVDKFLSIIITNSEDYIVRDIVNYVHPVYNLKGFMVRFTSIHGGINTQPVFIVDYRDPYSIQMYIKILNGLADAAKNAAARLKTQKWKEYYNFKNTCLMIADIRAVDGKLMFQRDLDYSFAITSHKSQGSTYDTVFVDVRDIVFDKNGRPYANADEVNRGLYVACSRCRNKLYLNF